jgi:uncharacterized phage protein (TIGR02218 family)
MRSPTNYGGFDLVAYLASNNQFVFADLYTFVLVGGFTARYTNAEGVLYVGGNTFDGNSIIISRSRIRTVIGVDVDTLNIELTAQSQHTLNGAPWLAAIRAGALDGARVMLERMFTPAWGDSRYGTVILFGGRMAPADVGRTSAKITAKSDLELLNIKMPRNLYQPSCLNILFDGGCTLTKASFGTASTVASGSSRTQISCGLAQAAGYFDQGTISFASGPNAGITRTIRSYAPGVITLALPLVTSCAVGDTFTAYAGCARTQSACTAKSNLENFRGAPYVPVPESVI